MQQPQVATIMYVGGQATVAAPPTYLVAAPQPTVISNYKTKQSTAIGILLTVSAILSFAFNSAELGVGLHSYEYRGYIWGVVGHGYWTGTMVNDVAILLLNETICTKLSLWCKVQCQLMNYNSFS